MPGGAPQLVAFLHQDGGVALVGQIQGCGHAGHAAADDQGFLDHGHRHGRQRIVPGDLGHRHAHLVPGLEGGKGGIFLVHPGVLVADIGHLQEIGIEPRLPEGVLEQGFVGPGGAGRNHDAVQIEFLDPGGNEHLGVGGAGEEVVLHADDVGQGPGIVRHCFDVHHPGDVDAAGADEHPEAEFLPGGFPLRRISLLPGQGAPGGQQGLGRFRGGGGGLGDGPGNGLGGLEGPADIDAVPVGGHRGEAAGPGEVVPVQVDAEFFGQFQGVRRGLQTYGEHRHIEVFLRPAAVLGDVSQPHPDIIFTGQGCCGAGTG